MMQGCIDEHEVRFRSSASPLHRARLFEWRGDLYRAVRLQTQSVFERLLNTNLLDRLIAKRLVVQTEPTGLKLDGYGLILKHRRVPFVTFAFEWPDQALKDAALAFIDLNLELAEHNLALCDGHPWNVLFDGPQPLFVDFGSFTSLAQIDPATVLDEFHRWFVYPLKLMAAGHHRLARAVLRDPLTALSDNELVRLGLKRHGGLLNIARKTTARFTSRVRRVTSRLNLSLTNVKTWRGMLHRTRKTIDAIKLEPAPSDWSGYYDDDFAPIDAASDWNPKQRAVADYLNKLQPATVHDVAGNRGWYAQSAQIHAAHVVCTDIDETCLAQLHRTARDQALNITAAHLNLRNPAASHGWSSREFGAANDRLRCDCVLALALMHHMVFAAMADFDTVLDGLAALTRRDLILEFVSRHDQYVSKWWTPDYPWYNLDTLADACHRRFNDVTVIDSYPHGRHLLVCRGLRVTTHDRDTVNAHAEAA